MSVLVKRMVSFFVISIAVYFLIAMGLLLSQWPGDSHDKPTISFQSVMGNPTVEPVELSAFKAGDDVELGVRHIAPDNESKSLVVIIHGSGWHGGGYVALAERIAASGQHEVLLPDLRGHGPNPVRRGDVDYIGQYEDDLAELISKYRKPGQLLTMIGHSSGGGLVIRFAGGQYGSMLDRVVLLAPFLKHDAPTTRQNSGGWASPLIRRFIGLEMLNMVGVRLLNGMTVLQFNFPIEVLQSPEGDTATQFYSYRLNKSYGPRSNYLADVAVLPPFQLLVGEKDDAFIAEAYEPTMSAVTAKGEYQILPGVDHVGIAEQPETAEAILKFLDRPEGN